MTQMWSFTLPDGRTIATTLDWAYVRYIKELQEWILKNWEATVFSDSWIDFDESEKIQKQVDRENWRRFYETADWLVETSAKPKHPMKWVLDKVHEHLDEPD